MTSKLHLSSRGPFCPCLPGSSILCMAQRKPMQPTSRRPQQQVCRAALETPGEVVQECLTAMRQSDTTLLERYVARGAMQLGAVERLVLVVAGTPVIETGPLAQFAEVADCGARRVLPGNLLRRCRVLSSLHLGPRAFVQRVAVTGCSGEEAVLEWRLQRRSGGAWQVASVTRDEGLDVPPPDAPHPRASPEAVVRAQLAALQEGDVTRAMTFGLWRAPGGREATDALLRRPFSRLLGHSRAELGMAALPSARRHLQEVTVTHMHSEKGLRDENHAAGPSEPTGCSDSAESPLEAAKKPKSSSGSPAGAGVDVHGDEVELRRASKDVGGGEKKRLQRSMFLWELGQRDSGCWLVTSIMPVSLL